MCLTILNKNLKLENAGIQLCAKLFQRRSYPCRLFKPRMLASLSRPWCRREHIEFCSVLTQVKNGISALEHQHRKKQHCSKERQSQKATRDTTGDQDERDNTGGNCQGQQNLKQEVQDKPARIRREQFTKHKPGIHAGPSS